MSRYSEEFQFQYDWESVGILAAAVSISQTDKSKATVEALGVIVDKIDDGTVAVNYRFLCDVDAQSNVVDIYVMRGDDHYTRLGTVTLTGGKAVVTLTNGTVGVFCDTAAMSNEKWQTSVGVASPINDDYASISLNTHGYSSVLFLATTFADTNIEVQKARQ